MPDARAVPARSRTRPSAIGVWLLAVAVPVVVLAVHMALYGHWLIDDAGITFAYARSIAAGAGPVLQPGAAPVEGWSDPSWLALLVLASLAGLFDHGTWFGTSDPVLFPKTVALLLGADRAIGAATVRGRVVTAVLVAVALVVSGASWLATATKFRHGPTVPLCAVATGMGAVPNAFGDILGVRSGRIATPDVGGTALTSRYEVVDLVGLVSAPIARYYADGDMAGLRDHVLDDVRPEFIEIHGNWTRSTGLLADPRTARRYVPVLMTARDAGYLVRRDLVRDPAALAAATQYTQQVAPPAGRAAPRSGCGTMRPGSIDALDHVRPP